MLKEIFDYSDYRNYLLEWIEAKPACGRGQRAALAQFIRGPVSHVSQVLKGVSNLSLEQAEEVNEFLGHTNEQSDFFLLLVQLGRAGTPKLKRRLQSLIQRAREKRLILKDRLGVKSELSVEDEARFYSSWHCAAVHILATIPQYQSKEAMAEQLGLSLKKITEIVEFLQSLGLFNYEKGRYKVGTRHIHLGSDSAMIAKHHINWRLKAMQNIQDQGETENLHYSSVVSISHNDVTEIKSLLVKAIENAKAMIRKSKEEELHSFCLDFFKV
jgi:uncharacterized protein (TIGR02147 family)